MNAIENKIRTLSRLRDEQKVIKQSFMTEYLRIRNSRKHKYMASTNDDLYVRLTAFNNELKKLECATILRCKELATRIKEHVDANQKLISNYSLKVEISCWGHAMAEDGNRFFTIISPEIIAELEPFDGFLVAKGESEMQYYNSANQLEVEDECWLYWVFREKIGLTPLALLSVKGMGCDVKIVYKSQINYSSEKWEKH